MRKVLMVRSRRRSDHRTVTAGGSRPLWEKDVMVRMEMVRMEMVRMKMDQSMDIGCSSTQDTRGRVWMYHMDTVLLHEERKKETWG